MGRSQNPIAFAEVVLSINLQYRFGSNIGHAGRQEPLPIVIANDKPSQQPVYRTSLRVETRFSVSVPDCLNKRPGGCLKSGRL
ncbi:MAG TPA: hypothetical protein V6C84_08330 [Coleofasciculaceae cyanobacterium]|jgi:hypothetical protein